ncbi:MAG: MoaD/ThiS family protein [Deltaproteobacteria bacterium]|nr:MoaD/ThiS family protein [Deltaproteobacteria bacterium]
MAILSEPSNLQERELSQALELPVTVRVVFMGELQRWAGRKELEIQLPGGSTINVLAEKLLSVCGLAFAQKALTKRGALQPHVAVFVNGVQVGRLEGSNTVLSGGKVELMLLPMYEGG